MKWNEKALSGVAGGAIAGGVAGATLGASDPGVALAVMGGAALAGAGAGVVAARMAKMKANKANKHRALGRQWDK